MTRFTLHVQSCGEQRTYDPTEANLALAVPLAAPDMPFMARLGDESQPHGTPSRLVLTDCAGGWLVCVPESPVHAAELCRYTGRCAWRRARQHFVLNVVELAAGGNPWQIFRKAT